MFKINACGCDHLPHREFKCPVEECVCPAEVSKVDVPENSACADCTHYKHIGMKCGARECQCNDSKEICAACQHAKHIGKKCSHMVDCDLVCACDDAQARKADAGKPNSFRLIPWQSIIELASVYEYGAKKYEANSWRQVPDGVKRYEDALMRHLIAYLQGEDLDKESNLRHLSHACWNVIALMELTRKEVVDTKIEVK